jgi:hypothetical protein
MGIHRVARDSGVLTLIPNAGVHAATRALCAPNVFRTSFSNSQPTLALGQAMVAKGHKKAVWITWKYAAGDEAYEGFKESYTKAGGTILKELGLPFPNVEFQALLTEIAAIKPDAVACFFADTIRRCLFMIKSDFTSWPSVVYAEPIHTCFREPIKCLYALPFTWYIPSELLSIRFIILLIFSLYTVMTKK